MNWDYHEDDYFINPQGVRFNFNTYRQWTDKYDFKRNLKEYFEANQRALFSVPETGQILCPMQDRCWTGFLVRWRLLCVLISSRCVVWESYQRSRYCRHGVKYHETGDIRDQLKKSKTQANRTRNQKFGFSSYLFTFILCRKSVLISKN